VAAPLQVAELLLAKLMAAFPPLLWSQECLKALFGVLEQEEGDTPLGGLRRGLPARCALPPSPPSLALLGQTCSCSVAGSCACSGQRHAVVADFSVVAARAASLTSRQ
jgi:hypothetical protein